MHEIVRNGGAGKQGRLVGQQIPQFAFVQESLFSCLKTIYNILPTYNPLFMRLCTYNKSIILGKAFGGVIIAVFNDFVRH